MAKKTKAKPLDTGGQKLTPFDQFNLEVPAAFPETGMTARAAQAMVNSEAWTDASPMLNLSSFVTTFAEPEELDVMHRNFIKNYIDHDMYPQVFAMETRMVKWLHGLWNGPKGVEPYGTATVGSSEACMLGGLAHKWNWREARKQAGKDSLKRAFDNVGPTDKPSRCTDQTHGANLFPP